MQKCDKCLFLYQQEYRFLVSNFINDYLLDDIIKVKELVNNLKIIEI